MSVTLLYNKKSNINIQTYKKTHLDIHICIIQFWDCASESYIVKIQKSQSNILREIVDVPMYVSNYIIQIYFNMPIVKEIIHYKASKHFKIINSHSNQLLEELIKLVAYKKLKNLFRKDF